IVANRHQPFGEDLDADRRAVVCRQLFGQEDGGPIAAEHFAHRGSGAGPGDEFVLLRPQSHGPSIRYLHVTTSIEQEMPNGSLTWIKDADGAAVQSNGRRPKAASAVVAPPDSLRKPRSSGGCHEGWMAARDLFPPSR